MIAFQDGGAARATRAASEFRFQTDIASFDGKIEGSRAVLQPHLAEVTLRQPGIPGWLDSACSTSYGEETGDGNRGTR
jgi:hypothetical protein